MNKSNCSGGCLALWPAVMADGKATAGSGVPAGMIGNRNGFLPGDRTPVTLSTGSRGTRRPVTRTARA
jgi:hypothetical protein